MQIANTILAQLGGNKFLAMTGAKDLLRHDNGLSFKLPRNFAAKKISRVVIGLTPADLYTITFYAGTPMTLRQVSQHRDVYADQLQALFTDETGLATRL